MRTAAFTIIEFILIILVLGILAAVALPRFIQVEDEAHPAQVRTVASTLATAVAQARAIWEIEGQGLPAENLQVFGTQQDGQLDFNAAGWPSQHWFGGIEANPSTNNVADCISVSNALLQGTIEISSAADADYQPTYLGGGRCRYTYTGTTGLSFDYDSNTGAVSLNF